MFSVDAMRYRFCMRCICSSEKLGTLNWWIPQFQTEVSFGPKWEKKKKRRQDDTLDNFKYDVVCRDYHYFFAFNCIRHDAIKTEKFLNLLIDFYSNHQLVLRSHYHKLLRLDVHSVIRPSQRRTISHFGWCDERGFWFVSRDRKKQ